MKRILPYLIIVFFWLVIFLYSETFTSGYHFIDDYEIITLDAKMDKTTFLYTAKTYILPDLTRRFRPFWALHRIAEVKVFGRDFRLWSAYTAFLCLITALLLYSFAVNTGIKNWLSLLFVLLTLTGPASVIWYQYAHSENLGMFFLSLSLFFLAKIIYSERKCLICKSLFVISLAICSLCKESFTLAVPAILFLYIWMYSDYHKINLSRSFKLNKLIILLPFLFSMVCIAVILLFIGTDKSLYAGVDTKILSPEFLGNMISTLSGLTPFWLMIAGFMLIYVNQNLYGKKEPVTDSYEQRQFNFINPLVFFLLMFLSQYALYYKSGFHTRYYLPMMLGFSFVIIYAGGYVSSIKLRLNILKHVYILFILLLIIFNTFYYTIPDIVLFNKDRRATTNLLNFTIESQGDNSEILTIMDPVHHWGFGKSFYLYMNNSGGKGKLYFKFIKLDTLIYPYTDSVLYRSTETYTKKYFTGHDYDSLSDNSNINYVNIFPGLEEKFLNENYQWFEKNKFIRKNFDDYVVYQKK